VQKGLMQDDNLKAGGQSSAASAENKTDEKTIPYERFQEVVADKNQLKTDLQSIREELEELKTIKTESETEVDWSDLTPKQLEERITAKTLKKIEAEQKTLIKEQQLRDQEITKSFEYLKRLGHNITSKTERAVLNKMIMTGSNDVLATYIENQTEFDKKANADKIKQQGFIPPSGRGSDIKTPSFSYNEIKGKSLMDIVKEAGG